MKWGYKVPNTNFGVTYEFGDEFFEGLKENGELKSEDELKQIVEFEYFLMSANRYRMAILDEQTLAFIIMNYETEKEKILKSFKDLAFEMAKAHDNIAPHDSKEQSDATTDASDPLSV